MAIDEGTTEVADSEEEPMTSSPVVGAADAADKLPAMATRESQELQDTLQNLRSKPQALGQDAAKSAPQSTAALDVDRCGASTNFNAPTTDQTDVKLEGAVALKKGQAPPQISHPDLAISSQMNSPGFPAGTVRVPVANSSIRKLPSPPGQTLPCTAAQALDSSSAPEDACSKFATDVTNACDMEGPSHVMDIGSSSLSSRYEDRQNTSEYSDVIFPSENAVHSSQAMGISDATRALGDAATNSLPPTTLGLTGSVSTPVPSKKGIAVHLDSDSDEIRGQKLRMNGGHCTSDTTFQEPVAKTQEASPFTPQIQTVLEKPQVRSLPLQEVSQPSKASQDLDTGNTATKPPSESQCQPLIGASPTTMSTGSPKARQEITLSELKAQKASLLASLRSLPTIQVLIEEMASSDTGIDGGGDEPTDVDIMNAANKIVKQHIKLLHEYNELKDVGQGLMGLIADQRGVRIVEVQEEFGVDAKD